MKIKTQVKAGKKAMAPGTDVNHNETLVREQAKAKGLKVKTQVKAGKKAMAPGTDVNHNETLVRN